MSPLVLASVTALVASCLLISLPAKPFTDRTDLVLVAVGLLLGMSFLHHGPADTYAFVLPFGVSLGSAIRLALHRSQRSPNMNRALIKLMASIVLGAILGIASGDTGAPDPMRNWLTEILGLSPEQAEIATIAFRKTVHFTYFGLMAWLAFFGTMHLETSLRRAVWFGLLWTATFAAFDEVSQLNSAKRSGSGWDFLLDMAGAAVFVLLAAKRFDGDRAAKS